MGRGPVSTQYELAQPQILTLEERQETGKVGELVVGEIKDRKDWG